MLPAPLNVDWDGNGVAQANDEWIELYNAGPDTVDLRGWMLDDAKGGSKPFRFDESTVLDPYAYLVLYRRQTHLVLEDRGDQVRLLDPNGRIIDTVTFGQLAFDASFARDPSGIWHSDWSPTPGRANVQPILTIPLSHGRPVPD